MENDNHPSLKWAERKDKLYITIELNDVKDPVIELTEDNRLKFTGVSGGKTYSFDYELYADVNKEESKWTLDARNIFLNIKKKEKGPYWNYLTKDKKKNNKIHLDWNFYVEEDEEDENMNMGGGFPGMMGGNDFMNMGGLGGMGGMGMPDMGDMGGMDDLDEDDVPEKKEGENLDDLDKPAEN